jgi:hypothetical protein
MAYIRTARINPYNIYGKCYSFDETDLNETRLEGARGYRGMTSDQYAPWSVLPERVM